MTGGGVRGDGGGEGGIGVTEGMKGVVGVTDQRAPSIGTCPTYDSLPAVSICSSDCIETPVFAKCFKAQVLRVCVRLKN